MAVIKKEIYRFGEEVVKVNFSCSAQGEFSCNLKWVHQQRLGINLKEKYSTLKEVYDIVNNAFAEYKNSQTSYRLLIAVIFGVRGEYARIPETGEYDWRCCGNTDSTRKLQIDGFTTKPSNLIGLEYEVLAEENRDGRISYLNVERIEDNKERKSYHTAEVGNYYTCGYKTSINSQCFIIPFTEQALANLMEVQKMFQKTAQLMINLITHEDFAAIIGNSASLGEAGQRMLENKQ